LASLSSKFNFMLFGFGVVSIDTNFTFALPLYLRRCLKFVVILPLGSGYPSFSKPFGKSVNLRNNSSCAKCHPAFKSPHLKLRLKITRYDRNQLLEKLDS